MQVALPKAPIEEPNPQNPPILLQESDATLCPEIASLVEALEIEEMATKLTPEIVQCVLKKCGGCQNGGSIISFDHTDEKGVRDYEFNEIV
jgi:hypothetical protein